MPSPKRKEGHASLVGNAGLQLRWMDDAHRPQTDNSALYLEMLSDEVWPEVRG